MLGLGLRLGSGLEQCFERRSRVRVRVRVRARVMVGVRVRVSLDQCVEDWDPMHTKYGHDRG